MSHKSYQAFWPVTGVVKTGAFKANSKLPLGHIGLVLQSTDGLTFIDPLTLGNRKIQKNKLSLVRGLNSRAGTRPFEKSMPIAKMEFLGIDQPIPYKTAEATVGFNGINSDTISFSGGTHQTFSFRFWGESLTMLGIPSNQVDINYSFVPLKGTESDCGADACEAVACTPIVEEGIIGLLNYKIGSGDLTVGDFATIKPIYDTECAPTLPTDLVSYYTLAKCDTGSDADLAELQASVTNANAYGSVERISRVGGTSTYKVATTNGAVPAANFTPKDATFLKGCAACPAGFTTLPAGHVYYVRLEDNGVAVGGTVETLANAVAGSATRIASDGDLGIYNVLLTAQLSETDRATFITANPTAQVGYEGFEEKGLCKSPAGTPVTWTAAGTANIGTQTYRIIVKDTECGTTRLAELQAAYPELTITEVAESDSHCRRIYETSVKTNVVVEGCDTFELIQSSAPSDYMGESWYKIASAAPSADCKCGFTIKMKDIKFFPPICLSDGVGSIKPELNITVSKSIPTDAGNIANMESTQTPSISHEKGSIGTGWGTDFIGAENTANFKATGIYAETQVEKYMLGQNTLFEPGVQYPTAKVRIWTSYTPSGTGGSLDNSFVISMPLIDTSENTLKYLETLNYN
jgi:hypothetical protein